MRRLPPGPIQGCGAAGLSEAALCRWEPPHRLSGRAAGQGRAGLPGWVLPPKGVGLLPSPLSKQGDEEAPKLPFSLEVPTPPGHQAPLHAARRTAFSVAVSESKVLMLGQSPAVWGIPGLWSHCRGHFLPDGPQGSAASFPREHSPPQASGVRISSTRVLSLHDYRAGQLQTAVPCSVFSPCSCCNESPHLSGLRQHRSVSLQFGSQMSQMGHK